MDNIPIYLFFLVFVTLFFSFNYFFENSKFTIEGEAVTRESNNQYTKAKLLHKSPKVLETQTYLSSFMSIFLFSMSFSFDPYFSLIVPKS
uniref:Putative ovule protein n=1 Tax=Solanum chacoense TaxID=4108 RepID=A0A0V0H6W8_SOLCH